jgi:hypothetical protein
VSPTELRARAAAILATADVLEQLADRPEPTQYNCGDIPSYLGWHCSSERYPRADVVVHQDTGAVTLELWDETLRERKHTTIADVPGIVAFIRKHVGAR